MANPQAQEKELETGCRITAYLPACDRLLHADALAFLQALHREFNPTRLDLLNARKARQQQYDQGILPDFLPETQSIRESNWQIAGIPEDLLDRRIEITGPVNRKMVINALNSGARVYMADFEDSHGPTWEATLDGHINIQDASTGEMTYEAPNGIHYELNDETAVLMVRPRGWHLEEKHLLVDGQPMSASLFDFGLNLFHTARVLNKRSKRPYYYLPKMEHYLEARLWNDVFAYSEKVLGLDKGTIKATALIETLPAVFQMNEFLYEMRDYLVGLNCGRWDYIFSYIKTFRQNTRRVLPERGQVGMTVPFLHNYSRLLIDTCHHRGAFAMGGMAAQIPIKGDEQANQEAMDKVRSDKIREVTDGHDGTWVAHPGLIPIARAIFDKYMPQANQIEKRLPNLYVSRDDLIEPTEGTITAGGLHDNIEVAITYIAAWVGGNGCVPIHHLMEDAATAEISRCQVWQWIHHGASLNNGKKITAKKVSGLIDEISRQLQEAAVNDHDKQLIQQAEKLFTDSVTATTLPDFLTLSMYKLYD